jgi:hypothetical protein
MKKKDTKNFSSLEDLGIAFGFEPEPKEEPKVVVGSSEKVKVVTSPIEVTTGIQIVPKVTERNITVPLGRGRESYTIYYKWLIHHKPGCTGPGAWEFTKFNDRMLKYPVKKDGKILDLWVNENTHNSQLSPERPVKVSSLSSAPEITISNCTAQYKIKMNKLYPKELNELIDKLNRISSEYECGRFWDKIYPLNRKIEDFGKLQENDTYLNRYNDFEGTFGVAPDTYQDKWDDDRIEYDQLAELREKFDTEKEISKLQEEIDKIYSKREEIESRYRELAEGLKKFTFKRLTREIWLQSLTGGERNKVNSTKEEDLPEWDYHDPNALVIKPAANWDDGNIWGKKKPYKVGYGEDEYYSDRTMTFIIDTDGKFWKYPKLYELAELKVSEDFKNRRKEEKGYYIDLWLHGPLYKDEEKTYIDPEFLDNVNVGLYDYCRILGVAGWVREGRKGKAELVFLPMDESKTL